MRLPKLRCKPVLAVTYPCQRNLGLYSDRLIVGGNRSEPGRFAHVQITLIVGIDRCGVGQAGRGFSVDDLDLRPVGSR